MNPTFRSRIVFALFAIYATALLSCVQKQSPLSGASGTVEGGKKTVAFSQMENTGPWRIAETYSMRSEAEKRADKYNFVYTDAQSSTARQVTDVENLIARKVSAIFLAPRESEGFTDVFQAARDAEIPVILIDREATGRPGVDFVTVIKSDFVKEGQRAAEWLAKQMNGKAGIVELKGTTGSSVARDRSSGFMDEIAKNPEMRVIASQDADFKRAEGQKVMENMIRTHGSAITAVFVHSDEMALGAIQDTEGRKYEPWERRDNCLGRRPKSALQAILDGEMNATVECSPRFGPIAFDTLERYWRGETIPPQIINEDRFFDITNAAQFVKDAF